MINSTAKHALFLGVRCIMRSGKETVFMDFSERVFCGRLNAEAAGNSVLLAGWVDALRDHGGLLFAHLRDRSGIVQVVFNPETADAEVCRLANSLRAEYCVSVRGKV